MLSTTLYIDKEAELNMEQMDSRFCLKLSKLFEYDLSIIGKKDVFEKIHEVLEKNLFDCQRDKELEQQLINKELLLEQAQIECLKDRIESLQRG
ncbi:hypothetical protein NRP93_002502 [Clostridium botulinum]|nr:hypothetical protein [Clostridium botulinum]